MNDTTDKVRRLRAKRNLTLVDLKLKTGLGMTTLGLADQGLLTLRTAALLAPVLGVKPEDLLPKNKP